MGATFDVETRCRVVDHLRQQSADIDAVGGTEPKPASQCRITEGLFHQSLTIIEGAGDPQRRDILPPACQLLFLSRTHEARRVQDHHAHPRPPVEGRGHCASGVAGGRHQYGQGLRRRRFQTLQTLGQEARAIECGSGSMIELEREQGIRAGRDGSRRSSQIQRGVRNLAERRL